MARKRNAKRTDGRYAVQVYLGMVDGKRKYKTVYGTTQKEANEKAVEIKLAIKRGINVVNNNDSFGLWAERFLTLKKSEVSNGRYNELRSLSKHLNKYLGDMLITKIKALNIQEILIDLSQQNPNTGAPASKKLLIGLRGTANSIFQLAINNRVMDYNPVSAVVIPKAAEPKHRRALTDTEQQWILDTPHRAQLPAMVMMYAGLRRGELLALTWSDIDLDNATIKINKAVEFIDGQTHVKQSTKTAAGMRIIDIPSALVTYLRQCPRESLLVCPSPRGSIMGQSSWTRLWEDYLHTLNLKYGGFPKTINLNNSNKIPFVIPRFTAHWLRHTFASILYMSGVDVLTAKEQLGHADVKTTMDIYTHLSAQFKRRSMSKVDSYLKGKGCSKLG